MHFTDLFRYYFGKLFYITLFYFFPWAILLYYIFFFIFQDHRRVQFMANINCTSISWSSPWNVMSSILFKTVQRQFLLFVYKFLLSLAVCSCIQEIFQQYFLLQFYLFFYSILISFQVYGFYTFRYLIASSKVWEIPKYISCTYECLVFDVFILVFLQVTYEVQSICQV